MKSHAPVCQWLQNRKFVEQPAACTKKREATLHHLANAKPNFGSDCDHDSGTDSQSELLTSDDSSSCSDSGEDDEV